MFELCVFEVAIFIGLLMLERLNPARKFPIAKDWYRYWLVIQFVATAWLAGLLAIWTDIPALWQPMQNLSFTYQVLVGYFVYSFIAYWYHRIRHTSKFLWHYVHYMHHAPAHMETFVTFWRHPVELVMDSIVALLVGKCLGMTGEVLISVLIVESMFELYHHSNINTPQWLRWLGYVIQLPEQHLIHHQRNLHRWNYATITLWDSLFQTVRVPTEWQGQVGVKEWNNIRILLFFRY